uniref:Uncharacterized protein n=1 Tax=Anguilla anguilla TaxID=7936 RepID=A0A0E9Q669_ANGAN
MLPLLKVSHNYEIPSHNYGKTCILKTIFISLKDSGSASI